MFLASMSEFKFACPVCGQHMMCDASQGGSVMECPTCFQKITAPQAPAADAKFILTGTKVSEKKISAWETGAGAGLVAERNFPTALLVSAIMVALVVGGSLWIFHGKLFKGAKPPAKIMTNAVTTPPPAPVAPPASDTNWLLTLDHAVIPNAPAVGRIHGQNFIVERAAFQNGNLILRAGTRGSVEFGVLVNFQNTPPETLAGRSLNILADTNTSARVTLRWRAADDTAQKSSYEINYAMRLEFGALANNRLPGKIYLCTPDAEKSYLMGKFTAYIIKPKPKPASPQK